MAEVTGYGRTVVSMNQNHIVVWPKADLWSLMLPWRRLIFIFSSAFPLPHTLPPSVGGMNGDCLRSPPSRGTAMFVGHHAVLKSHIHSQVHVFCFGLFF